MPTYNPGSKFTKGRGIIKGETGPNGEVIVNPHKGGDWAAPKTTPIHSAYPGTVIFSGTANGFGNVVIVEHKTPDGKAFNTLYAHMNGEQMAKKGDAVEQGQLLGQVGNTGTSRGPHLHFEVIPGVISPAEGGGFPLPKKRERDDPHVFDFPEIPPKNGGQVPAPKEPFAPGGGSVQEPERPKPFVPDASDKDSGADFLRQERRMPRTPPGIEPGDAGRDDPLLGGELPRPVNLLTDPLPEVDSNDGSTPDVLRYRRGGVPAEAPEAMSTLDFIKESFRDAAQGDPDEPRPRRPAGFVPSNPEEQTPAEYIWEIFNRRGARQYNR